MSAPEAHPLALKFPQMNHKDFDALVADIKANGQREPILIFEGRILDGRHRARACAQLGIAPITKEFDGDEAAAALLADSLNVHRRHLTRDQRRELIVAELKRDPSQSDRAIAEKARVDNKTVAAVRATAEVGEEIPHQEKRVGKDGIAQSVEKPVRTRRDGRACGIAPGKRHADERADEIRELVASGHNVEQIAQAQGVGVPWVTKIMDDHGIKVATRRTATSHADANRVASGTVDMLVGAAQGLSIFRAKGLDVSKEIAISLLPELREAMRSMRWFEQQLKEAANG